MFLPAQFGRRFLLIILSEASHSGGSLFGGLWLTALKCIGTLNLSQIGNLQ